MIAAVTQSLWESIHHRVGLALLVVSGFVGTLQMMLVRVTTASDGTMLVHLAGGDPRPSPAAEYLSDYARFTVEISSFLWVVFAVFATAPLLATFLQKGWVELVMSKGISRAQLLVGRFLGGALLFTATIVLMGVLPVLELALLTGADPRRALAALALPVVSFSSMFAVLSAIAIVQPNAALLGIAGFCQLALSSGLAMRDELFELLAVPRWLGFPLDLLYVVLPRHAELGNCAVAFAAGEPFQGGAALAASLGLLVVWLGVAVGLLSRRSF